MYDYVSPEKLTKALKWLKANNPLYADIEIASDWVGSAIADDQELVMSMLEQPESMCEDSNDTDNASEPEPMDTSTNDDNRMATSVQQGSNRSTSSEASDPVSHYASVLESFAREHGLTVHEVPRDGNCLFSSVAYQLCNVGHDVNEKSLRQMVVRYLSDHADVYSPSVHQPVHSTDEYNADIEPVDEEDAYIESITDPEVQQELRWQKYLRRLRQGAWGDSIAITAIICNLFNVSISVLCANVAGTNIATNTPMSGCSTHELSIGLIMRFHFVGLDKVGVAVDDDGTSVVSSSTTNAPLADQSSNVQCDVGEVKELDDETIAAGDQHRLEITGGTHASMMLLENPEQIVSIAPAEGQKPLYIMSDPKFELMSIPDKFCLGKGGVGEQRPRKITYRKYFNARLQDIDGRFARDLDYLFVAQYIVECKQVLDDSNNYARRQKPIQQVNLPK